MRRFLRRRSRLSKVVAVLSGFSLPVRQDTFVVVVDERQNPRQPPPVYRPPTGGDDDE